MDDLLSVAFMTGHFFVTARDRHSRVLEGIIAADSMMSCLAIA